MKSLSSVGLGLSIVFGCLLLALVAELYYLLWWKRKFTNRKIGDDYSRPARELFYTFCLKKKPSSLRHNQEPCSSSSIRITDTLVNDDQVQPQPDHHQLHMNTGKDSLLNPFGDHHGDPMVETQLMSLTSLSGPPRFLFTIIEETKEDLESEDGKSNTKRSLSDLLLSVETPYLTPLASPPFFTPPLTPSHYNHLGLLNHSLFESSTARPSSSPPPKFKFLQEAEEKLYRKILMEESERGFHHQGFEKKAATSSDPLKDEEDGSFITIVVDRNKERRELHNNHHHHQLQPYHSSTSQVLPLASSPSSTYSYHHQQPRKVPNLSLKHP